MANTKVGFGSYGDFEKFMRNAPDSVRRILFRAYPKYARMLTDKYIASTKKIEGAVKKAASKATQEVKQATKAIGTTASKAGKATAEAANKPSTWSKVGSVIKNLKNIAGTGAATWVISDPRTTWNQKILAGGLAIPHPTVRGASLAGLGATAIIPRVVDAFYERKNEPLFAPGGTYGDQAGFVNLGDLPPQLKPLTSEEYKKAIDYNAKQMKELRNQINEGIAANQAEQGEWDRLISGEAVKDQPPSTGLSYDNISAPVFQSSQLISRTPIGISNQPVQNTQQGGLIPIQDNQIVTPNQQALTGNVDVLKQFGGDIPDYKTWNTDVEMKLQDLQNQANQINRDDVVQPTIRGEQSMQNTAGNEALLQYLQMQNVKQQQAQKQGADILAQYQAALQADRRQNEVNALANAFGTTFGDPQERAPIYYIGAKGDMRKVELQQPNKAQVLPTNQATNANEFINMLKLRSAVTPKSTDDVTANVLTAQALGDMYNVNPLVFLNPDLAQEYMKSQGTIANTRAGGEETRATERLKAGEERTTLPLKTQANILEERAKAADNMARDKANAVYDIVLEQMKQSGMNDRQAQQIASQEAIAQYAQLSQNYRTQLDNQAAMERLLTSGQTQRDVANIYASGRAAGQSDNPLDNMVKAARIQEVLSSFQNPQQRQQALDFINLYSGGNNTTPVLRDNPYGTTINQDDIIRRYRGR